MPTVTKEAVFAAAADDIWAIVRDFGRLDDWLPPVVVCRTDRDGIGALRTLTLGDGAVVVERLEALDDAARTLTYSMADAGPMPLVDYGLDDRGAREPGRQRDHEMVRQLRRVRRG